MSNKLSLAFITIESDGTCITAPPTNHLSKSDSGATKNSLKAYTISLAFVHFAIGIISNLSACHHLLWLYALTRLYKPNIKMMLEQKARKKKKKKTWWILIGRMLGAQHGSAVRNGCLTRTGWLQSWAHIWDAFTRFPHSFFIGNFCMLWNWRLNMHLTSISWICWMLVGNGTANTRRNSSTPHGSW